MPGIYPQPRCGFWRRAAARGIDTAIASGVFFGGLLPMATASAVSGARPPDWLLMTWTIATATGYFCYEAVCVSRTGQTIGKRTMGVMVVPADGTGAVGLKASIIRLGALTVMSISVPFLGLAACVASAVVGSRRDDGRSWHDRPARTAVTRAALSAA